MYVKPLNESGDSAELMLKKRNSEMLATLEKMRIQRFPILLPTSIIFERFFNTAGYAFIIHRQNLRYEIRNAVIFENDQIVLGPRTHNLNSQKSTLQHRASSY